MCFLDSFPKRLYGIGCLDAVLCKLFVAAIVVAAHLILNGLGNLATAIIESCRFLLTTLIPLWYYSPAKKPATKWLDLFHG